MDFIDPSMDAPEFNPTYRQLKSPTSVYSDVAVGGRKSPRIQRRSSKCSGSDKSFGVLKEKNGPGPKAKLTKVRKKPGPKANKAAAKIKTEPEVTKKPRKNKQSETTKKK